MQQAAEELQLCRGGHLTCPQACAQGDVPNGTASASFIGRSWPESCKATYLMPWKPKPNAAAPATSFSAAQLAATGDGADLEAQCG